MSWRCRTASTEATSSRTGAGSETARWRSIRSSSATSSTSRVATLGWVSPCGGTSRTRDLPHGEVELRSRRCLRRHRTSAQDVWTPCCDGVRGLECRHQGGRDADEQLEVELVGGAAASRRPRLGYDDERRSSPGRRGLDAQVEAAEQQRLFAPAHRLGQRRGRSVGMRDLGLRGQVRPQAAGDRAQGTRTTPLACSR